MDVKYTKQTEHGFSRQQLTEEQVFGAPKGTGKVLGRIALVLPTIPLPLQVS